MEHLKKHIRKVPDFPHAGISFRDITPLLINPQARDEAVVALAALAPTHVDLVAAVEARGFLFGALVAQKLSAPLVLLRKPGKLPRPTFKADYSLEYGSDSLQIHQDDLPPGARTLLVDDLLATGGTLAAACQVIETAGAHIAQIACLIELTDLNGRQKLASRPFAALLQY